MHEEDPFYGPQGIRCLEFVRSSPAPRADCELGYREQMNQVTAYIDASPIYSSSARSSDKLRIFRNGKCTPFYFPYSHILTLTICFLGPCKLTKNPSFRNPLILYHSSLKFIFYRCFRIISCIQFEVCPLNVLYKNYVCLK